MRVRGFLRPEAAPQGAMALIAATLAAIATLVPWMPPQRECTSCWFRHSPRLCSNRAAGSQRLWRNAFMRAISTLDVGRTRRSSARSPPLRYSSSLAPVRWPCRLRFNWLLLIAGICCETVFAGPWFSWSGRWLASPLMRFA